MPTVPARLRNAFLNAIEEDQEGPEACELVSQLLESDDILPREYCEMLDAPEGTTFGAAAQAMSMRLGCAQA
ncbi:MAG: hypothetical protein NVSMB2_05320 [Chloroflexota bacterium]